MHVLSRVYSNDLEKVEVGQFVYLYKEGEHELFKVINKSTDYNILTATIESVKTGTKRGMAPSAEEMFFIMKDVE